MGLMKQTRRALRFAGHRVPSVKGRQATLWCLDCPTAATVGTKIITAQCAAVQAAQPKKEER